MTFKTFLKYGLFPVGGLIYGTLQGLGRLAEVTPVHDVTAVYGFGYVVGKALAWSLIGCLAATAFIFAERRIRAAVGKS